MAAQNNQDKRLEKLKSENQALKEKVAFLRKEKKDLQRVLKRKSLCFNFNPVSTILVQERKIIDINRSALKTLGYKKEEILGKYFLELVPPNLRGRMNELHKRRISGKAVPDHYETDLITSQKNIIRCDIMVKKIKINGRLAFVARLINVEERGKRERELIRSEKMEAFASMAYGLNRRCHSYFEAITENTKRVIDAVRAGNRIFKEGLNAIEDAANELTNTSRLLKRLSPGENVSSNFKVFDLDGIVNEAVISTESKLQDLYRESGRKFNLKTYLRSKASIKGDKDEIGDLIINILFNAIEAMPDGGDIYLTTEENLGSACIYIQDSGTGIHEHIKEKIYDPFFTTKGDKHSGLGLSLSYAIVRSHRGDLEVDDNHGQGTVVTVKLPLAPGKPKQKASAARRKVKNAPILIIENGEMVGSLLSQFLKSKGYLVDTVETGTEGINKLKKRKFDMVILDSGMLDVESDVFINKLKKISRQVAVALITGQETPLSKKQTKADLIITKPVDMDRVVARIPEVLVSYKDRLL